MWNKFLDYFRLNSNNSREPSEANRVINGISFYLCLFGVCFYYFHKFLQAFLKRTSSLRCYQRHQFAHLTFNLVFHTATVVFLVMKHSLAQAANPSSKYDVTLFHRACESDLFRTLSVILISFYLMNLIMDMFEYNVLGFLMKILYICVLICCLKNRLENFSVTLNIRLSALYVAAKLVSLIALSSNKKKRVWLRFLATLKLFSWSYCFLNLIPLGFMLPTIQSPHSHNQWLQIILGMWYTSSIWNSPILKYFYHQLYHGNDCVGKDSASRCILLRDSLERRHMLILQESMLKVKLAFRKENSRMSAGINSEPEDVDNQAAKAYQTIKCMMTLKRKLKSLRQEKSAKEAEITELQKNK